MGTWWLLIGVMKGVEEMPVMSQCHKTMAVQQLFVPIGKKRRENKLSKTNISPAVQAAGLEAV